MHKDMVVIWLVLLVAVGTDSKTVSDGVDARLDQLSARLELVKERNLTDKALIVAGHDPGGDVKEQDVTEQKTSLPHTKHSAKGYVIPSILGYPCAESGCYNKLGVRNVQWRQITNTDGSEDIYGSITEEDEKQCCNWGGKIFSMEPIECTGSMKKTDAGVLKTCPGKDAYGRKQASIAGMNVDPNNCPPGETCERTTWHGREAAPKSIASKLNPANLFKG